MPSSSWTPVGHLTDHALDNRAHGDAERFDPAGFVKRAVHKVGHVSPLVRPFAQIGEDALFLIEHQAGALGGDPALPRCGRIIHALHPGDVLGAAVFQRSSTAGAFGISWLIVCFGVFWFIGSPRHPRLPPVLAEPGWSVSRCCQSV